MDNKTHVLILQHQRERSHPFNTARIVNRALVRSRLVCGRNDVLGQLAESDIQGGAALLYPGPSTPLLSDLSDVERPNQLIVLDGTWHHVKTMLRDIQVVRDLPRYSIAPATPGQYRIRLEPTESSLSTVEATVAALQTLEPETEGLERLISCFSGMVEAQLSHPNAQYKGRVLAKRNTKRPNIPHSIVHDLKNIVIAYGESAGREWAVQPAGRRVPVYWVAERMETGEIFECAIEDGELQLSAGMLDHLELAPSDFHDAVGHEAFRASWRRFVRPNDTLTVYNQSTFDLLGNVGIAVGPHLVLKSVKVNAERRNGALESVLKQNLIAAEPARVRGRAGRRLAGLSAYVKHLNRTGRYGSDLSIDSTAASG